jgi:hypothetical protein
MTLLVSLLICAFLVVFEVMRIVPAARGAIDVARRSVGAMRDPGLADEAREAAVRRGSIQLLGAFFSIAWRSLAAVGAAWAPIYLADETGLVASATIYAFLARWDVILVVTAIALSAYYVCSRVWRGK